MLTEADTCRKYVLPKLQTADWETDLHSIPDDSKGEWRKYYCDGGKVEIAAHLVYELDAERKQLRVVQYIDYADQKMRMLFPSTPELPKEKRDFFDQFGGEAKAILNEPLEKFAKHGTVQFVVPYVLKIPPISDYGNVMQIIQLFGGADKLRDAVNQLQTLRYAA